MGQEKCTQDFRRGTERYRSFAWPRHKLDDDIRQDIKVQ